MKLPLPSVTLLMVDCIDLKRSISIIEHCKSKCDFGDIKLLTHFETDYEHAIKIPELKSLVAYSVFMLTKSYEYINTTHVMTVQRDGWILNTSSWDQSWLRYDYIGGLFMQYNKVGSGGFSLRTKKIMEHCAKQFPQWDWSQDKADKIQSSAGWYEDGYLCFSKKMANFKIASLEDAANFSQAGNRDELYLREKPFGWHRTWQVIDFKTGIVDSSDKSKDIHVSYDSEIDSL